MPARALSVCPISHLRPQGRTSASGQGKAPGRPRGTSRDGSGLDGAFTNGSGTPPVDLDAAVLQSRLVNARRGATDCCRSQHYCIIDMSSRCPAEIVGCARGRLGHALWMETLSLADMTERERPVHTPAVSIADDGRGGRISPRTDLPEACPDRARRPPDPRVRTQLAAWGAGRGVTIGPRPTWETDCCARECPRTGRVACVRPLRPGQGSLVARGE